MREMAQPFLAPVTQAPGQEVPHPHGCRGGGSPGAAGTARGRLSRADSSVGAGPRSRCPAAPGAERRHGQLFQCGNSPSPVSNTHERLRHVPWPRGWHTCCPAPQHLYGKCSHLCSWAAGSQAAAAGQGPSPASVPASLSGFLITRKPLSVLKE